MATVFSFIALVAVMFVQACYLHGLDIKHRDALQFSTKFWLYFPFVGVIVGVVNELFSSSYAVHVAAGCRSYWSSLCRIMATGRSRWKDYIEQTNYAMQDKPVVKRGQGRDEEA